MNPFAFSLLMALAMIGSQAFAQVGQHCESTGSYETVAFQGSNATGQCEAQLVLEKYKCRVWDHNGWLPDSSYLALRDFTYRGDLEVLRGSRNFAKETFNLISGGSEDAQWSYNKSGVLKQQTVTASRGFNGKDVSSYSIATGKLQFHSGGEYDKVRHQGSCTPSDTRLALSRLEHGN